MTLQVDSIRDRTWPGQVVRINPAIDERMRTCILYIQVDNTKQPRRLMPGSFVRATIEGRTLKDVVVVPRGLVRDGRVFVLQAGEAKERPVEVTHRFLDKVVIKGVNENEVLITSNLGILYDGAPVEPATNRVKLPG